MSKPPVLTVLETRPQKVSKDVVDVLEKVLGDAREGAFRAVAISFVRVDGRPGFIYSEHDNAAELLGVITYTQGRLTDAMAEGNEQEWAGDPPDGEAA